MFEKLAFKKLAAVSALGLTLTACYYDYIAFDGVSIEGSILPFSVLRDDLIDGKTQQTFEVRNGGYGSAATAHPYRNRLFYALTDRGPNATFTGDLGKGKMFPVPDYTPRIGLFELDFDGSVKLRKEILLKRPDGTPISGLPNSAALGGTGETPYNADGAPILVDQSRPYDALTNPLRLDDFGLDGEGLVALRDGGFWVSDEYGPHMVRFNAKGVEVARINPFADDPRNTCSLPAEFANRRANRGMEGLAITPDEKVLVGIMQSTMDNPSKSVRANTLTRIVTINVETCAVQQYLYKQEKVQNSNSEIVALSNDTLIIIERDGAFLYGGPKGAGSANPAAQKQVYKISLSSGTELEAHSLNGNPNFSEDENAGLLINGSTLEQVVFGADGSDLAAGWSELAVNGIVPVEKYLIADLVAEVNYPHDKMEGLWVIDENRLGILNDDDFATWATGGVLEQKMLDANTVDGNRLYVIDADLSVQ